MGKTRKPRAQKDAAPPPPADGPKLHQPTDQADVFEVVAADDLIARKMEWLCPDMLSLGSIWILDGQKGTGKSTLARAIAVMISGGPALPGGEPRNRGDVLWFAGEESPVSVREKYYAAGGRTGSLHFPGRDINGYVVRQLAIPVQEELLQETVKRHKAGIIVLDTLACFTGGVELNAEIPCRSVMSPLTRISQNTGCLVLALRHPRKQRTDDPLMRGQGNVAVAGAARGVLTTGKDPDTGRPVFGLLRGNDSKSRPVYAFEIVDVNGCGVVEWGPRLNLNPDRIEFGVLEEAVEMLRSEAQQLLKRRIGNKWVEAKEVLKEAKTLGVSPDQMDRARWKLGVQSRRRGKIGGEGHWEWGPPEHGWPEGL